jgi:cellulase/cellobiase CelA1
VGVVGEEPAGLPDAGGIERARCSRPSSSPSSRPRGNGPLLNRHPTTEGVEALCNPPGRGLGPRDTTVTGFPHADAFLWTHTPGNSSGHCNGGPDSGSFWMDRALDLAAHANDRIGPSYPSQPY